MPCPDPLDRYNRENDYLEQSALTALLCGVMNGNTTAIALATEWVRHHNRADQYRVESEQQRTLDGGYSQAVREIDGLRGAENIAAHAVLMRAYRALSV